MDKTDGLKTDGTNIQQNRQIATPGDKEEKQAKGGGWWGRLNTKAKVTIIAFCFVLGVCCIVLIYRVAVQYYENQETEIKKAKKNIKAATKKQGVTGSFEPTVPGATQVKYGPYSQECLLMLWEEAGCAVAGSGSPVNDKDSVDWWNTQSVSVIRRNMKQYRLLAEINKSTKSGIPYTNLCKPTKKKAAAIQQYNVTGTVGVNECGEQLYWNTLDTLEDMWSEVGCVPDGKSSPNRHKKNAQRWHTLAPVELKKEMTQYKTMADLDKGGERTVFVYRELCYGDGSKPPAEG